MKDLRYAGVFLCFFPQFLTIKGFNMARQIQIRRGTTLENDNFTGAVGEITMDTDAKTLRVHDGETIGGVALARASDIMGDYVIETQLPTAENNYTWYRKYKSGWVEMGGITSVNNVTFPVEMADTNYTFFRTNGNGRSGTGANELYTSVSSRTTTGFMIIRENAISPVSWCVYGIAK